MLDKTEILPNEGWTRSGTKGGDRGLKDWIGHWELTKFEYRPKAEQPKAEQGRLSPKLSEKLEHKGKQVMECIIVSERAGSGGFFFFGLELILLERSKGLKQGRES